MSELEEKEIDPEQCVEECVNKISAYYSFDIKDEQLKQAVREMHMVAPNVVDHCPLFVASLLYGASNVDDSERDRVEAYIGAIHQAVHIENARTFGIIKHLELNERDGTMNAIQESYAERITTLEAQLKKYACPVPSQ